MKTKEKILLIALEYFARDGYEGTSLQMIADRIGITKGAFYRHYSSKQDIFAHIVERMKERDAERPSPLELSGGSFTELKHFILNEFTFWAEDEFAVLFRRMLTIEQFRSEEMSELYQNWLGMGPIGYLEDIFREMMVAGIMRPSDPARLALSFWAPVPLLLSRCDAGENKDELLAQLSSTIDAFSVTNCE